MKVKLGNSESGIVKLDYSRAMNGHMKITGDSGSGKSYFAQKYVADYVEAGGQALIFGTDGVLDEKNLNPTVREAFFALGNEIRFEEGIPIPLFSPMKGEDTEQCVLGLTNMLADMYTFGVRQFTELHVALKYVIGSCPAEKRTFGLLLQELYNAGSKESMSVFYRLLELGCLNTHLKQKELIQAGAINRIIFPTSIPSSLQSNVCEIVLGYLWKLAHYGVFEERGLLIFIDEIQNWKGGKGSILPRILREGRKFGLHLLAVTQDQEFLKGELKKAIDQAGTKIYFKPALGRCNSIAKQIGFGQEREVASNLRHLDVGEFIATGDLWIDEERITSPLKIVSGKGG